MTEQCTYTGRNITPRTHTRTRPPAGCALEAWGEDELARMMRKDAGRACLRMNYALHGGGWVRDEDDAPGDVPSTAEIERRERAHRHAQILDAMQPGEEYTVMQIADALGWPARSFGSPMKSLRQAGKVTSRTIQVQRASGKWQKLQAWRKVD